MAFEIFEVDNPTVDAPERDKKFTDAPIKNDQIWDASHCNQEFLPHFIRTHKMRIKKESLETLTYQVEHHKAYPKKKLENGGTHAD